MIHEGFFVLFTDPVIGQFTHLTEAFKDIPIQYLIVISTIESFNKRILCGLTLLNELQMNAICFRPIG